jgi:hypothetical protein
MFYVLEVIQFINDKTIENNRLLNKHIGYMNVKFRTKKDACSYYKKCNPHMRPLNAHGDYQSDWDPNTKLLYIVRDYYGIYASIPPFVGVELEFNGDTYLYYDN